MAPDVIADTAALHAAKKACKEATKKVEEVKLAVTMARAKLFELYVNLFVTRLGSHGRKSSRPK